MNSKGLVYIYSENQKYDFEILEEVDYKVRRQRVERIGRETNFEIDKEKPEKNKEVENAAITLWRMAEYNLDFEAFILAEEHLAKAQHIYKKLLDINYNAAFNIITVGLKRIENIIENIDDNEVSSQAYAKKEIEILQDMVRVAGTIERSLNQPYQFWEEKMMWKIRQMTLYRQLNNNDISEYLETSIELEYQTAIRNSQLLEAVGVDTVNYVHRNFLEAQTHDEYLKIPDLDEEIRVREEVKKEESVEDILSEIENYRKVLSSKIFGQNKAIETVVSGLWNVKLFDAVDEEKKGPLATFFFTGAPGCGKTYLAESIGELLNYKYKKLDMSEYNVPDSVYTLIGFDSTWKDSTPGILTKFVGENPKSVIVFDEIEKAHPDVLQLFLQLLDKGVLRDKKKNQDVFFDKTILVFTSNVGATIYDNHEGYDFSKVTNREMVDVLSTETNAMTKKTFFSKALVSRFAKGYMCMFNKLSAIDLKKIVEKSFTKCAQQFETKYGIHVSWDSEVPMMLLLSEGELADARNIAGKAENYMKEQIKQLFQLYSAENIKQLLNDCKNICFKVEKEDASNDVKQIFEENAELDVLVVGANKFANRYEEEVMPQYKVHKTNNIDAVEEILKENTIGMLFVNIRNEKKSGTTLYFDRIPITAKKCRKEKELIEKVKINYPEISIFLLEDEFVIDENLEKEFLNIGVTKVLRSEEGELTKQIEYIEKQQKMQQMLNFISNQHKYLDFESVPIKEASGKKIKIRIRNLSLKLMVESSDRGMLLGDVERPNVKMEDVIGGANAKEDMKFAMQYLKNPKTFSRKRLPVPKGILLYGAPGTGKTMLAKAFATECNVSFIEAKASEFVKATTGSGPQSVRDLFQRARRYAPCVIFIDEIDAIGAMRGKNLNAHSEEMTLNALLTEMEGFATNSKKPVFVIAATNAGIGGEEYGGIGTLDEALVRRFDSTILVELPNEEERLLYLHKSFEKIQNHKVSEEMLKSISERTIGASVAKLEIVIHKAIRKAVLCNSDITDEILDNALETVMYGEEKKQWGKEALLRTARHEAGHAFISAYYGNIPAYLTISARGTHGGYMQISKNELSKGSYTKRELLNRVDMALAGRGAEMVYYGEEDGIGTGASQDLMQATNILKSMICNYGMDEEFGMATISEAELQGTIGERVYKKVSNILTEELNKVIEILAEHKEQLNGLVDTLLIKNQLRTEEIKEVLDLEENTYGE